MKVFCAATLLTMASAMTVKARLRQQLTASARWLKDKSQEEDLSWMANYTMHFDKCHALPQVSTNSDESPIYTQYLAEFSLCPNTTNCKSGCRKGGKYIVDMGEFVRPYLETRKEIEKAACKAARENCSSTSDSDVLAQCYADAGLENCDQNNGQQDFNIDKYMECKEMDNKNGNKNGNKNNGDSSYNTK
jgi:hypothetical protein